MIIVGTTLTTYSVLDPERSYLHDAWLRKAEALQQRHDVKFFVAIELDGRGLAPFQPLLQRLGEVGGEYWTFSLDDGRTAVTGENRGRHITMGQNLISEYASSQSGCTHLLHMAADTEVPDNVLVKLLEVHNGIAAAACSTYFTYDQANVWTRRVDRPDMPLVEGPMTAVAVLIERGVFTRLRWRWDVDLQMTDDPSYSYDAQKLLGVSTLTRLDCEVLHHPAAIGPVDTRYPGIDLSIQW